MSSGALTIALVLKLAADPMCGGDLIKDPYTLAGYAQHENPKLIPNIVGPVNPNGTRDYGLAQINERNFGWLGLTYKTALEPCASLHAAAQYLVAMSVYNTGDRERGFRNGYVRAGIEAMDRVKGVSPSPRTETPAPQSRITLAGQIATAK